MTHTELAEITAIDLDKWTVDVTTKFTEQHYIDVQIPGAYCHVGGAYIGAAPEEGGLCYIMWSDDAPKDRAILTYLMPYSFAEGYKGGRPGTDQIGPGDAIICTNTGNQILVKQDDSIIIASATGVASRVYDGRAQTIVDLADSYSLSTGGGFIEWRSNELLTLNSGISPVTFTLAAKKTKADLLPIFQIEIGNIDGGDPTNIMKVSVNPVPEVFESLGLSLDGLTSLYERTISLLGVSIEKCLTKVIEAEMITLKASTRTGGFGIVSLGEDLATEPLLKGQLFIDLLTEILSTHRHSPAGGTIDPVTLALLPSLASALSFKCFTG